MVVSVLCATAYFLVSCTHGMYLYLLNLISLHTCVTIVSGFYTARLLQAYSIFFVVGTMLSMYVPVVGFQPTLKLEFYLPIITFVGLQIYAIYDIVRNNYIPANEQEGKTKKSQSKINYRKRFDDFVEINILLLLILVAALGFFGRHNVRIGWVEWTQRVYAIVDPTYGKKNMPIMASVSEHQPTAWASFFFDLHLLVMLFPCGLYYCFQKPLTDGKNFLIVFAITALYFSASMVRLIMLMTPVACIIGGMAISAILNKAIGNLTERRVVRTDHSKKTISPSKLPSPTKAKKYSKVEEGQKLWYQKETGFFMCLVVTSLMVFFVWHCIWVAYEQYSNPSLIMSAKKNDGSPVIFDDFREAFGWLRKNTKEDAKVLGWWDYGYYINSLANRTSIIDNNVWNKEQIGTMALAMVSSEEHAYKILRKFDVDYVMVVFGGMTGYASDDMNKIVWMLRIAENNYPALINHKDYYVGRRRYHVGKQGPPKLLNSLLYKLTYLLRQNIY